MKMNFPRPDIVGNVSPARMEAIDYPAPVWRGFKPYSFGMYGGAFDELLEEMLDLAPVTLRRRPRAVGLANGAVQPGDFQMYRMWHQDGASTPDVLATCDALPAEYLLSKLRRKKAAELLGLRVSQLHERNLTDDRVRNTFNQHDDSALIDAGLSIESVQPFEVVHHSYDNHPPVHRSSINETDHTIFRKYAAVLL